MCIRDRFLGVVGLASYIIWNKIKAMKEEIKKLELHQNMGLSDKDVEKISQESIHNFIENERKNEIERRNKIERDNELERQAELERQNEIERQAELERQNEIERQAELERQNEIERQAELERQNEIERQNELERRNELERKNESKNPYKLETIYESDSDEEVEIIKVVPGTIEVKVKEESVNESISGGLIFDADIEPENVILTSDNDLELFSAEELTKELDGIKIEDELVETVEPVENVESVEIIEPVKKKRGRPRKTTS